MSYHIINLQSRSRDPKSKRYGRPRSVEAAFTSTLGTLFHRMLGLKKVTLHWSDGSRTQYWKDDAK